jgi:hypothetical protein
MVLDELAHDMSEYGYFIDLDMDNNSNSNHVLPNKKEYAEIKPTIITYENAKKESRPYFCFSAVYCFVISMFCAKIFMNGMKSFAFTPLKI